jgi:4-hydroxy-3-methylbut-2-enyl diphosphate reductase IspH
MVTHVTHFEKVAVFSRSARSKVRTEENVETVERQMEDKPQLSLRQVSQQTELSVSTWKELFETILKIQ